MSTKDIRQAVASPTHVIVTNGTAESDTVGYRARDSFKGDLGLGTSLTVTANNGAGSAGTPAFSFTGDPNTGIYNPSSADVLAFSTNGTEKMRVTSAGNVGIGTTTPSAKVHISGAVDKNAQLILASQSSNYGRVQFGSVSDVYYVGGGSWGADWTASSGVGMAFVVNQSATPATATLTTAGVWTNASDARYKENIVNSPYGLSEVMQLNPVQYNMIGEGKKQIGLIAQDILSIIPEVVESVFCEPIGEDRYTLSYGNLVSVCVKAIQEQQAIIEQLKTRIEALEGIQQ